MLSRSFAPLMWSAFSAAAGVAALQGSPNFVGPGDLPNRPCSKAGRDIGRARRLPHQAA